MLIVSKQSFECTNPSTGEKFFCRNMDIVTPPDWVAEDPYFKALCADKKITCHIGNNSAEKEIIVVEEEKASKRSKKA